MYFFEFPFHGCNRLSEEFVHNNILCPYVFKRGDFYEIRKKFPEMNADIDHKLLNNQWTPIKEPKSLFIHFYCLFHL